MYFIYNVKTYANVNSKGRAMIGFALKLNNRIIRNETDLSWLEHDIRRKVAQLNAEFNSSKPIVFKAYGSQLIIEVDDCNPVCIISYAEVSGYYKVPESIKRSKT